VEDLRTAILKSFDDPGCPASVFLMINMSESRSIYKRSLDDIKTVANFVASLGKRFNGRIALVASGDLPYGLMRMSTVGSEDREITSGVFRTIPEARKWLLTGRPQAK
jgi:hypothetical protein